MIFGSAEVVLDERFRKVHGTRYTGTLVHGTYLKHGELISTMISLTLSIICYLSFDLK